MAAPAARPATSRCTVTDEIDTTGGASNGIYAQSIGGNGGAGGMAVNVFANFVSTSSDNFQGTVDVTVGGSGGSGQDAGEVSVTNTGTITTGDDISRGIFAQSVGGGGGDGGSAGSYSIGYTQTPDNSSSDSWTFWYTLGGSGGSAGDGDTVTVDSSGAISTSGIASYGIFAQSVGGGGGNGGDGSPDLSGWVADVADIADDITTAQSIYDSLSDPSSLYQSFTVDVGGSGGASGDGKEVEVEVESGGTLYTTGNDATAIFAQSVGGGGGSGGDGSQGLGTSYTAGGLGSGGGDGGEVKVTLGDTITTTGERAMGIFAQSVGGGGGAAGDVEVSLGAAFDDLAFGTGVISSSSSGSGGDGGDVTVTTTSTISTSGSYAHGIWAQSVGGSGGAEGMLSLDGTTTGAVGSAGDSGDGGDIKITTGGAISVSGDYSTGIVAQSVGGSSDGDKAGSITIEVGADITASGTNDRAILANTEAESTNGLISITVDEGATVSSGGGHGYDTIGILYGVNCKSSTDCNVLTNNGTIENTSDNASYVLRSSKAMMVENYGVLTGSMYLDGTETTLTNYEGGTLNLGTSVNIQDASTSTFSNAGTMSPDGTGSIGTTSLIAGVIEQTSTGTYQVDLTLASDSSDTTADLIEIANSADVTLAGTVTPNSVGTSTASSGDSGSIEILSGSSLASFDTSSLSVADTATVDYSLTTSGDDLYLGYSVDYTGDLLGENLSGNAHSFGEQLGGQIGFANANLADGSDEQQAFQTFINSVLNATSAGELETIYDEHTLDEAGVGVLSAVSGTFAMHDVLHSCPQLAAGPGFFQQQQCLWAQPIGSFTHQDETGSNPGYDEKATGLAAGIQMELRGGLFLEVAGEGEGAWVDGSNFSQDGYRLGGGAALKKEFGRFELSGTLSGGVYGSDFSRSYSVGT